MAIQYNQQNKLFQVDYQSPFGGIDSTAYASAIDPHNFVDINAGYVEDNYLKSLLVKKIGQYQGALNEGILGFIPVNQDSDTIGYLITSSNIVPIVVIDGVATPQTPVVYAPTKSGTGPNFSYIVIDSIQTGTPIIYWTTAGWNEIWSYDTLNNTAALVTNYVGGGILGLLDNQLLNLGGTSAADGTVPNRISWSAPGAYGQFQPYDVTSGTGNYAAGFNDLPSTSDVLTGFMAIGTVGYLFRSQGITQVNPTGNGIQPFQFNHLWASQLGVGSPYPNSVSQYGSLGAFVSEAALYTLGLSGLGEIGAAARTYLFKLIGNTSSTSFIAPNSPYITGYIVPYLNLSPELFYVVGVPTPSATYNWQILAIGLNTGKVYNLGTQILGGVAGTFIQLAFVNRQWLLPTFTGQYSGNTPFITETHEYLSGQFQSSFYAIQSDPSVTAIFSFRKEQMKFGFIPTVTKIAFLASLVDTTTNGTISISIDGGSNYGTRNGPSGELLGFPDIVVTAGVAPGGDGVIDNLYSDGVVSIQRPQLVIKLTNIQVAEVWYQGTLANYELI